MLDEIVRGLGEDGSWRDGGVGSGGAQRREILLRDDAADHIIASPMLTSPRALFSAGVSTICSPSERSSRAWELASAHIGFVEARDDAPRSAGAQGPGTVRRLIDGFDTEAIGGTGHELVEAHPFERRLGSLSPFGLGPSRRYRCLRAQCCRSVR